MRRRGLMLVWVFVGMFVGAGCGSEGKDAEPCTVVDNGGSATITCPDGSSATVNDGANGAKGADGINGTNGLNGTNGTTNKITSRIFCGGQLSGESLWYDYTAAIFATGDVWAHAGIFGDVVEVGSSAFYASTAGAPTAPVIFTYDLSGAATGGWWQIELNRPSLVSTTTYHDPELGGTGTITWVGLSSECTLTTY